MPKSYLSDEPGAQRAAEHQFDPYRQTFSRLGALTNIGHRVDKVELIVLGGTWSFYPEAYQIWFIKSCFDAMNDFGGWRLGESIAWPDEPEVDFRQVEDRVDGSRLDRRYNEIVAGLAPSTAQSTQQAADWPELEAVQRANETAEARCVGLVLETRPDHLTRARRYACDDSAPPRCRSASRASIDEVLELNRRGHDVASTRRSVHLLRRMGFKIHAHWMPNLYGSSPEADIADYRRLFDDPDFRPDELKIYPCSLIESAELMQHYNRGTWRPYTHAELLQVLSACLTHTPEYCRLTRIIRDIPGTDIVDGNKLTNFREIAEHHVAERGETLADIRAREVGEVRVRRGELELKRLEYETSSGTELFLQYVDAADRLAAFLRLALPDSPGPIDEIRHSAVLREVHVYGRLVEIGRREQGRSQHLGLGRSLIDRAAVEAEAAGFDTLSVISSVGTRQYYRSLGFEDGELYQHRSCRATTR